MSLIPGELNQLNVYLFQAVAVQIILNIFKTGSESFPFLCASSAAASLLLMLSVCGIHFTCPFRRDFIRYRAPENKKDGD